jgi:uncharacterized protein YbjT (DUF2867 family)
MTSKKIFVIGATGETGIRLARQLVSRGHIAYGTYRKPEQAEALRSIGVRPVYCDLANITVDLLAEAIAGIDAVVFTAGANQGGDEMTSLIDGQGVVTASAAASLAGVSRFLLVSAFPDAWREKRMPPDFEHYMFVKRQADVHLASTELDWVIVRPGTLTDSPGTGEIRIGLAIPYGDVSRDDVAATLVELVETPEVRRIILEVTNGNTPINTAIRRIANGI